jgi:uncharacterized membrane protein
MPSSVQEHWFARMWLLKPVVIGTLAAFWTISGLIGLFRFESASAVLTARSLAPSLAHGSVLTGAMADILLGLAILVRKTHSKAAIGMVGLTLVYLVFGTLLTPGLWVDPLGPLVKTLPALVLALVALAIAGDR